MNHNPSKIPSYLLCIACLMLNSVICNVEETARLIWDEEPKSHWTVFVLRNHNKVFSQHCCPPQISDHRAYGSSLMRTDEDP